MSPVAGMVMVRGQLDPEGGAALATALDAVMAPPGEGDDRSPAQRRADALVDLARRPLAAGELPAVGGQRPQVGVLLFPQALSPRTLAALAEAQRDRLAAQRLRELSTGTDAPTPGEVDWARPGLRVGPHDVGHRFGRTGQALRRHLAQPGREAITSESITSESITSWETAGSGPTADPGAGEATVEMPRSSWNASWSAGGWADPPWLSWVGPIAPEVAQRIACDADVFRIILDPATGMPLDVGRAHRLVPYWIRKALHARDRGCRWTGCTVPAEWTDGHHLDPWGEGGHTKADRCVLLCRHHHGLVHEGGWDIDLDPHTGEVVIARPGGAPYLIPGTRSASWTGPTTQAG